MASVSTVSLQHKLLEIFRAYFEQDSKSPSDWMPELFKNIPLRIKDLHYYVNIDYGSFPKKDLLIHRLNQWLQEPNVFSEMALTVEIGSKVIAFEVHSLRTYGEFFKHQKIFRFLAFQSDRMTMALYISTSWQKVLNSGYQTMKNIWRLCFEEIMSAKFKSMSKLLLSKNNLN